MCKNLKLYVWDDDFMTDYTSGIAFAVASNIIDAKIAVCANYLSEINGARIDQLDIYREWLVSVGGGGFLKDLQKYAAGKGVKYLEYVIDEVECHSYTVYDISKDMDTVAYCIGGGS